jgi:peptidoglycan biosynthesis protein MviN/MurJ (putative lipid II flippase)
MISILLDVLLSLVLFRVMAYGGGGLALSNSLAALLCFLMMYYYLKFKALPELSEQTMLPSLLKVAAASVLMGAAVFVVSHVLHSGAVVVTGVGILVGVVVYAVAVLLLKIPETQLFLDKIGNKLGKKLGKRR